MGGLLEKTHNVKFQITSTVYFVIYQVYGCLRANTRFDFSKSRSLRYKVCKTVNRKSLNSIFTQYIVLFEWKMKSKWNLSLIMFTESVSIEVSSEEPLFIRMTIFGRLICNPNVTLGQTFLIFVTPTASQYKS